ncbi:MAG: glutamate racemase [Desulfovibrionaceae bacterium]|nr:glutamate racemase [Desulfovibrionaceae bacterium]
MFGQSRLPIGLFDSGMGGLTVFSAIASRLPREDLLYLGDTARLPYGTKSRDTIVRYTVQAAQHLIARGIKMLVLACNTATANALPELRARFAPLPVLGVVEPGALAAVRLTKNGHIIVLATEATIKSGVYSRAIAALKPDCVTTAKACALFVPMAEEGLMEGPLVESMARYYLDSVFAVRDENTPDTVILGCTHYPLLKGALERVVGPDVAVVDPAATVAETVACELHVRDLLAENGKGSAHFMTTDNRERFARTGSLFLGRPLDEEAIELVDL